MIQTIQNNNPKSQTEEAENVSIINQAENKQDFFNEELIL